MDLFLGGIEVGRINFRRIMSMAEHSTVNIAGATLTHYIKLDASDLRRHEKHGSKDGKANIPASSRTNFTSYEMSIISAGKTAWAKYKSRLSNQVSSIDGQIKQSQRQLDEGLSERRDQLINEKEGELAVLETRYGPASAHQIEIEADLHKAETKLNGLELKLSRGLQVRMLKIYLPFLIFLALIEMPVNKMAFALFFDEGSIVTSLLALAIGTIFVYFAHVIGTGLKHTTCNECDISKSKIYSIMGVLTVFSVAIMFVLAKLRQRVAEVFSQEGGIDINQFLDNSSTIEMIQQSAGTQLSFEGFTLMVLNLAIFAAGLVASFYRHDAHPDYEIITNKYQHLKSELAKRKKTYEHDIADLEVVYTKKIDFVDTERADFENKILSLENDLERYNKQKKEDFNMLLSSIEQEILSYQAGNQTTRTEEDPSYFGDDSIQMIVGGMNE